MGVTDGSTPAGLQPSDGGAPSRTPGELSNEECSSWICVMAWMDRELEKKVKECHACQSDRKMPSQTPLHSWEWPEHPWSWLNIDYPGPMVGHMLLIVVDSHSKWFEVHVTTSATATTTIEKLRTTFATHGLPEVLVSDNGPTFVSTAFEEFLQQNGIKHLTSALYYPASNGLAE